MALILDTGPLYASLDRADADHPRLRRLIEESTETLVIPAPVLVEVDYWIQQRLSVAIPSPCIIIDPVENSLTDPALNRHMSRYRTAPTTPVSLVINQVPADGALQIDDNLCGLQVGIPRHEFSPLDRSISRVEPYS